MRFGPVSARQLPQAFSAAFADYAVDTSYMTAERIRLRCAKNNVDLDLSVGAYDGERLVGFTLIGIDDWAGERTAFDAGTGIVPEFRGRGLAQRMFEHALPALRRHGVTRFLLEVLQVNEAAIRAYRKAGFEITRELSCFELDVDALPPAPDPPGPLRVRPVDRATVLGFRELVDWQPSWENGFPAIERIPDGLLTFGALDGEDCVGVVAYSPEFNWILTLVVQKDRRRRGVGTALLRELAANLPDGVAMVRLLNVDKGDRGMLSFLDRLGFRHEIDQFEMARPI